MTRQNLTRPALTGRLPRRPGLVAGPAARRWVTDALIALAVTAAQVGGMYGIQSAHPAQVRAATLAYVMLTVGGVSLIARRRYPVGVLGVTLITALVAGAENAGTSYLALIVAFFTAVLARKRAAAVASLLIGYLASVWPLWLIGQRGGVTAGFALGLAVGLLFLLSVAEVIRSRSQRAAALAGSRAEELRRRASEERMRIARELHDVVAHNISVINVQANTALHLMDRQPDRARSALTTINEVSKQALVELRSVLGVLRDVDDSAPRAPAPGLARLGELTASAAAAGLAVRIEEDGPSRPLPADVDLAAYRIVQEAVTNSARHSAGDRATIRLSYHESGLEILVDDDGPPGAPGTAATAGGSGLAAGTWPVTGNGIMGMSERAAALGGTLQAGHRPGGGFTVRAWLPAATPAQPEPAQPELAQREPQQRESEQPPSAQAEPAQPHTEQPPPAQPDSAQPHTEQPPPAQPDSAQPGSAQPGSAQASSAQPDSAQPDSAQPGSAQASSAQPGSQR